MMKLLMAKNKNIMATHIMEATGLRVIGMYVREFFHWGWEETGQMNDSGLDGEIIPRTKCGHDLGANIKVQSKCGPGYISSEDENYITIKPYSSADRLKEHVEGWNKSVLPVILVYTNPEKRNKNGNKYYDLKNPSAWWIRVDTYEYGVDGKSVIKIPKINKFQEHSKGELYKLVKPFVKDWTHYPLVAPSKYDLFIYNSLNIFTDAKKFYSQWALVGCEIQWNLHTLPVKLSRIGWRHITNKARKDRVRKSMCLLPIARKILELSKDIEPVVLKSDYGYKVGSDTFTMHLGYRARVIIDGKEEKVQVVLKRHVSRSHQVEKLWFYSVHIIK